MTRLLMVVDDFVAGGAFKVGERLALGLADRYQILFACSQTSVNVKSRHDLANAGVKVVKLFAHAGDTRRAICDHDSALALISRTAPDKVLFIDSSPRSSVALKDVACELGLSFAAIINFVDRETPATFKRWDSDVSRAANAACANVFVSAAARSDFELNFPLVVARRLVVTNGVPDEFFQPVEPSVRRALRHKLAVSENDVLLLLPGRLEQRKGQHLALSALASLSTYNNGPALRLVLAGHGEADERTRLADRIRILKLENQVQYIGQREDLPFWFDACDIVLMPSAHEADALASKEAMAKGRPVVATDVGGVREQGHPDALLIPAPAGSPETTIAALAGAIDDLRRDPAKRGSIGHDLREIAKSRFTMMQMVEAYRRILDDMPTRRVQLFACKARPLPAARWLQIGSSRQASSVFKDGWSDFEDEGLWSVGTFSRIAFALEKPTKNLCVALEFQPLTAGPHRRFCVIANGKRLAVWTFADTSRRRKTIRISLPTRARFLIIRLCNLDPVSPLELGLGKDSRQLGIQVFSLRIGLGGEIRRAVARLMTNSFQGITRFRGDLRSGSR